MTYYQIQSSQGNACKPLCEREKMPWLSAAYTDFQAYEPGWVYGICPGYSDIFAFMAGWVEENWKPADRPVRMVWLAADTGFGMAPVKTITKLAEERWGWEVFGPVLIPELKKI